ncbi:hypothetical protein PGT21_022329 [Puccinia graminis f. sp. tritici]|uniref:Uncharacterized protein n=1 Tax=Puccinia graminis f. sp. tritici TaxID=56615 RepID=A0A5B0RGE5_PUCGR|nr:hypothetical protein PGT21_022329 [Puccinia graminis f. sp. tritici]KAA1124512.1 hypothetical protein PGTUg99_004776 [Puccinia graminis f. sp. tritici]
MMELLRCCRRPMHFSIKPWLPVKPLENSLKLVVQFKSMQNLSVLVLHSCFAIPSLLSTLCTAYLHKCEAYFELVSFLQMLKKENLHYLTLMLFVLLEYLKMSYNLKKSQDSKKF